MNIDIKNLKTAKRYALALKESAKENYQIILEDLKNIDEIIFENPEFKSFFLHPKVSLEDKKQILNEALKDKINTLSLNFIQNLFDENRFNIFKTILELYSNEVDIINNIQRIEVISAVNIDNSQKERLEKSLSEKLNKTPKVAYSLDSSILGGIIVKFEDKVIDLSLKTKFETLKKYII